MQETLETQVRSLGRDDPMEEGMATHSSLLAWRTPGTEEPDGLQSMGFSRHEYWSGVPFGGSKNTADGDCSHEIKRRLLLERKAMTNLVVAV